MMTVVRFDGFEQMAFIVGTVLSPVLFRCAGYEGAFRWAAAAAGAVLTLTLCSTKIALATLSLVIVTKVLYTNTLTTTDTKQGEQKTVEKLSRWAVIGGERVT